MIYGRRTIRAYLIDTAIGVVMYLLMGAALYAVFATSPNGMHDARNYDLSHGHSVEAPQPSYGRIHVHGQVVRDQCWSC